MQNTDQRVSTIQQLYADVPKIEVKAYTDLTVDFAHREHATYFIKGVRTIKDFEYEREQADINRLLGGMETLLFVAEHSLPASAQALCANLYTLVETLVSFCHRNDKTITE